MDRLELADVLGQLKISKAMLYKLIAEKQFPPPVKIGARSGWPQADVDTYLVRRAAAREVRA